MRVPNTVTVSATHLKTFDLDQLLQSVHDIEVTLLVVVPQVTCVEPALTVDDLSGISWSVEVTPHHLRHTVGRLQ